MMRKDVMSGAAGTGDPREIAKFNALAQEWRDPQGRFRTVLDFNAARLDFLRRQLAALTGRDPDAPAPLEGLRILDAGCGAGLVTEALAQWGADVLGVDAAARNIEIAQRACAASGAPARFRQAAPEEIVAEGAQFDVVLSLEVVEHVANLDAFLDALASLVRPGGLVVIATMNRTARAFLAAIVAAEWVLGWMPRGTHDWRKFVRPAELDSVFNTRGFAPGPRAGLSYLPGLGWRETRSLAVNYMAIWRREECGCDT